MWRSLVGSSIQKASRFFVSTNNEYLAIRIPELVQINWSTAKPRDTIGVLSRGREQPVVHCRGLQQRRQLNSDGKGIKTLHVGSSSWHARGRGGLEDVDGRGTGREV